MLSITSLCTAILRIIFIIPITSHTALVPQTFDVNGIMKIILNIFVQSHVLKHQIQVYNLTMANCLFLFFFLFLSGILQDRKGSGVWSQVTLGTPLLQSLYMMLQVCIFRFYFPLWKNVSHLFMSFSFSLLFPSLLGTYLFIYLSWKVEHSPLLLLLLFNFLFALNSKVKLSPSPLLSQPIITWAQPLSASCLILLYACTLFLSKR